MKTLLVIAFALLAVLGSVSTAIFENVPRSELDPPSVREKEINATLNYMMAILAIRDPLQIKSRAISVLGHSVLIENATWTGFSKVYASKIKINGSMPHTLNMVLELARESVSIANWTSKGAIFYGNGSANYLATNSKLNITANVNEAGAIKIVQATPAIGHANVTITGIMNNEEISKEISHQLNYLLNDYVNNNKEFHADLRQAMQDFLDENYNE